MCRRVSFAPAAAMTPRRAIRCFRGGAKFRKDFLGVKLEELFLPRTDLMHVYMIESRVNELVDRIDMLAWLGPEDHVLGNFAGLE